VIVTVPGGPCPGIAPPSAPPFVMHRHHHHHHSLHQLDSIREILAVVVQLTNSKKKQKES